MIKAIFASQKLIFDSVFYKIDEQINLIFVIKKSFKNTCLSHGQTQGKDSREGGEFENCIKNRQYYLLLNYFNTN